MAIEARLEPPLSEHGRNRDNAVAVHTEFSPLARIRRSSSGLPVRSEVRDTLSMEFRVLGPLEVLSYGRTLELSGEKQRALLAVLLLEANRVVSRERLIELITISCCLYCIAGGGGQTGRRKRPGLQRTSRT
jgi:hypothetical protein